MSFELRDFSDVAPQTTIASDIIDTTTVISVVSGSGYPSGGSAGDFMLQIGDELVKCASRTGNTFTVAGGASGRGQNGTTAVNHTSGVIVNHVATAINDMKEANLAVTKTIGQALAPGDILVADAPFSFTRKGIGAEGSLLQVLSGVLAYGPLPPASIPPDTITASMIADLAIDSPNKFATGVVTTAAILDGTIVDGDAAAGTFTDRVIAAANKDGVAATPSMRTIGSGAQQVVAGNDTRLTDTRTPTDNSVTTAKLLDANVTSSKLAAYTGGMWRRTSDQVVANTTVTAITFPIETYDSDGFLTPTSGTVTIPTGCTGIYAINFRVTCNADPGAAGFVSISGSGTAQSGRAALGGGGGVGAWQGQVAASVIASFTAADTVTFFVFQASGGNLNFQAELSLIRIGHA